MLRDLPRLILVACIAVAGPSVAADIYKWVDAHGVTQYGSTPPAGVAATRIGAPTPPDPAAASQAAARARRTLADAERATAEIAAEQARRDADRQARQQDGVARLQQCAAARQQLEVVSRGGPVYRFDTRGGRDFLADAARDGEIRRLRADVDTLCHGLDSDAATRQRWQEMQDFVTCQRARQKLEEYALAPAQTPQRYVDEARGAETVSCHGAKFPPGTGRKGEWFPQF